MWRDLFAFGFVLGTSNNKTKDSRMQITPHHPYPSRRSPVIATNMVAASQPLAAQAGLGILAKGGNAADAAIATAIMLTLVEPTGCGLGSDAFAIVWDGKELQGLNASGRAPALMTPERFEGQKVIPFRGWESVTVPGAVSGWLALSKRFGRLPFEALFEPTIQYAEEGFHLSPIIAQLWAKGAEDLKEQMGFAEMFIPTGQAPKAGELIKAPDMAETLRQIAETEGRAFYQGKIAEVIEDYAVKSGAALRLADLASHKADWCGTVRQDFDDITLHEIPPNGQGIAALMALGMLSHSHIRDLDPDDPRALHLQIEAMKLALRDAEHYVADPDYMTRVSPEDLLDPEYLKSRAKLIQPQSATDFKSGAPKTGGTVYLSTADETGMMVSFIQSNYAGFGSGICIPGTGIHLQNRGAGFSLDPQSQNYLAPGKRPFHTIIPAFLMKAGNPLMSFGVMGGPMQAQGHLQMTLRTCLWGQDPQMAIDAPRWRVTQGLGLACETTLPEKTRQALADMGHDITLEAPDNAFGFGGAQLIYRLDNEAYLGGSESRKDGQVVGF